MLFNSGAANVEKWTGYNAVGQKLFLCTLTVLLLLSFPVSTHLYVHNITGQNHNHLKLIWASLNSFWVVLSVKFLRMQSGLSTLNPLRVIHLVRKRFMMQPFQFGQQNYRTYKWVTKVKLQVVIMLVKKNPSQNAKGISFWETKNFIGDRPLLLQDICFCWTQNHHRQQ